MKFASCGCRRFEARTRKSMMADLIAQFTAAKKRVEASDTDKSNAKSAHEEVRSHLESDAELQSWGIDTVLIGSYKRHVAIRKVKDVDILSKLPGIPADVDPKRLLGRFETVLTNKYGQDRVTVQDRSIKVEFPRFGLAVDAVPARPYQGQGDYLEIPDKSGGWELTNPEHLTTLTTQMNERYDEEYVPLVKFVRQTRRYHLGEERPGGFYFEILCYHAADQGLAGSTMAALFTSALRSIAAQLQNAIAGSKPADPTIPGRFIQTSATDAQLRAAASEFSDLASRAEAALRAEQCEAAKGFRAILGENDDGEWVLEMPAACNEDGSAKSLHSFTPGDRTIPAGGNPRFAL